MNDDDDHGDGSGRRRTKDFGDDGFYDAAHAYDERRRRKTSRKECKQALVRLLSREEGMKVRAICHIVYRI